MKFLIKFFTYICAVVVFTSCNAHEYHSKCIGGAAYLHAKQAALSGVYLARDLTDDEMDDADNMPGGGYNDGKWTGENPPTEEDEDGTPTYAAQQVWEDENGDIIILEDDGEITIVET